MTPSQAESIAAIRSVRLASHELANACRTFTGGTEMAIGLASIEAVAIPVKGFAARIRALLRRIDL